MAERKEIKTGRRSLPGLLLPLFLLVFLAVACGQSENSKLGKGEGRNRLEYAEMLRMYDGEGYSVAELMTPGDTSKVMKRYVMVPADSVVPGNLPEGTLLRTPLKRMTVFSTIYTDALADLGAVGNVAGVVDAQYMNTPAIKAGLASGKVADCGSSTAPTAERILATRGDGILYCQYEGMDITGIDRLGMPLITMIDNYETSPPGRAEWLLFLGELTGKRAEAEQMFSRIAERYQSTLKETSALKRRPKVMTDNLYQGVWYVPGGNSYQACLIADAGGDYILAGDQNTGTLNLSLEEMMVRAKDADVWIMRSVTPLATNAELLRLDSRYSAFSPFKKGNVFVADGSKTDVFTVSAFHPDIMLREYADIFLESTKPADNSAPWSGKFYQRLSK